MFNVQGLGRNQVILTSVPDGEAGTAETIDYAKQLVAEGQTSPVVRALALKFLKRYHVQPHDKLAEIRAIFSGVLRDFEFRDDPAGTEMLQPAEGIIATGVGDCDDLNAILLCSLLGSIGFATRVVTIKADPERPDEFSHIYMEAQEPESGEWIALDVARENPQFGREPEYFLERKEWPMTSAPRYLTGYGLGVINPMQRGLGALMRKPKAQFPRRGLGQDTTDTWGSGFDEGYTAAANVQQSPSNAQIFAAATPAILQGIAQVTKAANTPGQPYSGIVSPSQSSLTAPGVSLSGSSGWIIAAILVVGGIWAFKSR